jgi:RNA polymerase sigma-70 factor (ECF subfamily)
MPLLLPGARREMPASQEDLVESLSRVARGDKSAFEALYAATCVKLYGVVVRILGRRDLAQDVLQDVYVRVWQRAGEFDPTIGSPITWMVAIARNRALDEAKRKTMRSLEDMPELLELADAGDPLASLEMNEQRRRLQVCLDRLEPERKRILALAYHYGLTREEIARRVNRPAATVKTWLRRSLAQLKDCLGP